MSPITLRIFLSSPGDVADERKRAREVMKALENGHLLRGKVRFEIVDWDDPQARTPMDARETPQDSVNRYAGRPSDCDLTVVILWSRIGTPLPPEKERPDGTGYSSGTVWEYEDARSADKPIYIYRRAVKPQVELDDDELEQKRAQYEAVKQFFKQFTNADGSLQAGFNTYTDPVAFETLLKQHLEAFLNQLGSIQAITATFVAQDDPRVTQILTLVDELARKNRQISEQEAAIGKLQRENDDLRRAAVARTLTAAAQPDASAATVAAASALEAGDSRPAEALLGIQEREEAAQVGNTGVDDAVQRNQAAKLAREQGALAMGHDVRKALAAFRRAVEYEPNDTWTHFFLGDLQVSVGDLKSALQCFKNGADTVAVRLQADPEDTGAQRDLSAANNRIGDVLVEQGNGEGALAAYRKALGITESLAARDENNTLWQRDVAITHNKIGDVLVKQDDGASALKDYRIGLAITQSLADRDPDNTELQRDVSVSHNKIGDVLLAQGDKVEALKAFQTALTIADALAKRDADNTEWQRDLAVCHNKNGDVQLAQNDKVAALASFRAALAIVEALTSRDPANAEWQRDVEVSHNKVGDVLLLEGDSEGALQAYRQGLAIAERLAESDVTNAEWQTDVAYSCAKLSTVATQPIDVRKDYVLRGREILVALKRQGRLLPRRDWISWFDAEIAKFPK